MSFEKTSTRRWMDDRRTNGRMDRRSNGRRDRPMDGWMDVVWCSFWCFVMTYTSLIRSISCSFDHCFVRVVGGRGGAGIDNSTCTYIQCSWSSWLSWIYVSCYQRRSLLVRALCKIADFTFSQGSFSFFLVVGSLDRLGGSIGDDDHHDHGGFSRLSVIFS